MFRRSSLILLSLVTALTVAGPFTASADVSLCPEGQFLEISYGYGGSVDVYDSEGNWCCQFQAYLDGDPIQLYPGKLRKISYEDGSIINMEHGEQFGPFPVDRYQTDIVGDYLIVQDLEEQIIEIYDAEESVLTSIPRTGEAVSWMIDESLYIIMEDQEAILAQRFDLASGTWSSVTGSCFDSGEVGEFSRIYRLGERYLISGWGINRVVTQDWEQLYMGFGQPLEDSLSFMDYQYTLAEIGDICYFLEESTIDGEDYVTIFDSNLQEVLHMPAMEWYETMSCRGEFLTGIPSDVLEGRVCDGLMGRGGHTIPYAREDGICYFPMEGRVAAVAIPEDETPDDANQRYLLTYGEDYKNHLYDIVSGTEVELEVVLSGQLDNPFIYLGSPGYSLCGFREEDNQFESYLYDEDGRLIAHGFGYPQITPWYPGQWYYRNELSDGIIDENGHWLLRRWLQRD